MELSEKETAWEIFLGVRDGRRVPTRNDISAICDLSQEYLSEARNSNAGGRFGIFRSLFYLRGMGNLPDSRAKEIASWIFGSYTLWGLTPEQLQSQAQIWIGTNKVTRVLGYLNIARLKEREGTYEKVDALCTEAEEFIKLGIGDYRRRIDRCYDRAGNFAWRRNSPEYSRFALSLSSFREASRKRDHINSEGKLRA